eukprot:36363_1
MQTSKRNQPKLGYIKPSSIHINVVDMETHSKDTIPTDNVQSVPLSTAPPTTLTSKRNQPKLGSYIKPLSININVVPTVNVQSVPLSTAPPTTLTSKRNQPKLGSYIKPLSI